MSETNAMPVLPPVPWATWSGLKSQVIEILSTPRPTMGTFDSPGSLAKIDAIKHFRAITGWGLMESKKAVESLPGGGLCDFDLHPGLLDECKALITGGSFIDAIKRVREKTACGLKEAKVAMDALRAEMPEPETCLRQAAPTARDCERDVNAAITRYKGFMAARYGDHVLTAPLATAIKSESTLAVVEACGIAGKTFRVIGFNWDSARCELYCVVRLYRLDGQLSNAQPKDIPARLLEICGVKAS